ncbi:RagB/SusD family nutrient uptake outer membrane protein [Sphingobacterium sp. SGG-5]|uniref:RagB/SusD family nutrient uptake outer membrane protein n=1 Tax=Sphingobacterium sp. SGG-5 TaxID=2710881 RepID=UPI0013EA4789|nr:RagB/SusD family nutrient uptake outer membrane protein [Sphingobacterium sp. SGG-5]NGM62384.1 RagB/SusD family nutrient uptake outer membrane protein [Sphingobacterium sp. SGG-5]
MKNIQYLLTCIFLLSLSGCNKFLDILPDDKPVLEDAFKDKYNAEKYLFTCYRFLPVFANPHYTLGLSGGGDIIYNERNRGAGLSAGPPAPMMIFLKGNNAVNPYANFWDGTNGAIRNYWQGIRHCNVFLEHIRLEDGGPRDLDEMLRTQWIAEVTAIKAYLHFCLLQLYGPIPIVDKVIPISAKDEEIDVYREPVDQVVDYIVHTLDEAIEGLPDLNQLDVVSEWGRFTKTIARCIKAKTLVLAASPIFNNNNYYNGYKDKRGVDLFPVGDSQARWERALTACDEAVRSAELDGAHILISTDGGNGAIQGVNSTNISDITKAMVSLRQAVTESWNPEVIWATNESTTTLQQWSSMLSNAEWFNFGAVVPTHLGQRQSPTINVVEMFYSSHGVPIEEDMDWESNGWYQNRYKTQLPDAGHTEYFIKTGEETAILHFNRSLRFYASVGFDGGIWEGRQKALSEASFPNMMKNFGSGFKLSEDYTGYPYSGYLTKKLSPLGATYTDTRITLVTQPYSFPIIRLADIHLLLAECLNEVGGPGKTDSQGHDAYFYLDQIRARVGMEGVVDSWNKYALPAYKSKPNDINGLRDIIRRERMNELAFEGHFYYDVRRWLIAENMFNKPILGWNKDGENKQDFYNIRVLLQPRFSMKDYLMPIRTNTLLQNRNLVQNPGW